MCKKKEMNKIQKTHRVKEEKQKLNRELSKSK